MIAAFCFSFFSDPTTVPLKFHLFGIHEDNKPRARDATQILHHL